MKRNIILIGIIAILFATISSCKKAPEGPQGLTGVPGAAGGVGATGDAAALSTGSITGYVALIDEYGMQRINASGITVAVDSISGTPFTKNTLKAVTDASGKFTITGVAIGTYNLSIYKDATITTPVTGGDPIDDLNILYPTNKAVGVTVAPNGTLFLPYLSLVQATTNKLQTVGPYWAPRSSSDGSTSINWDVAGLPAGYQPAFRAGSSNTRQIWLDIRDTRGYYTQFFFKAGASVSKDDYDYTIIEWSNYGNPNWHEYDIITGYDGGGNPIYHKQIVKDADSHGNTVNIENWYSLHDTQVSIIAYPVTNFGRNSYFNAVTGLQVYPHIQFAAPLGPVTINMYK